MFCQKQITACNANSVDYMTHLGMVYLLGCKIYLPLPNTEVTKMSSTIPAIPKKENTQSLLSLLNRPSATLIFSHKKQFNLF